MYVAWIYYVYLTLDPFKGHMADLVQPPGQGGGECWLIAKYL